MSDTDHTDRLHAIACPFCGLVCDDLSPALSNGQVDTATIRCTKARAGFAAAVENPVRQAALDGEDTTLKSALESAAELLQHATAPLIGGMIGDLHDTRAALSLAEHCGGVLDHDDGDRIAAALQVYQETGWLSTSLGELRNRADLVVVVGQDLEDHYPRWREKLLDVDERLHVDGPPRQLQLAVDLLTTLGEARALCNGKPVACTRSAAQTLVAAVQQTAYPVFVIGDLVDVEDDLVVRAVVGLVRDINRESRAAMLHMGGDNGGTSAQLAAAWQTGFGIRTSFATGVPVQDWRRYAAHRLLDAGEADVLVWISSLSATPSPSVDVATIVFGHPAMAVDAKHHGVSSGWRTRCTTSRFHPSGRRLAPGTAATTASL